MFSLLTAQASYATFRQKTPTQVASDLQNRDTGAGFSASQANQFADRYQLIAHAPNDGTGFSATVFAENNPGGPPRYTIAMRGTEVGVEPGADLLNADLGEIGLAGYAASQTASMYRLYRRLTTPKGQAVAYSDAEVETIVKLAQGGLNLGFITPSQIRADQGFDAGQAAGQAILPAGAVVDVTGHSLGGHLAVAFARLFPTSTGQVFTLNAPGFGGLGSAYLT